MCSCDIQYGVEARNLESQLFPATFFGARLNSTTRILNASSRSNMLRRTLARPDVLSSVSHVEYCYVTPPYRSAPRLMTRYRTTSTFLRFKPHSLTPLRVSTTRRSSHPAWKTWNTAVPAGIDHRASPPLRHGRCNSREQSAPGHLTEFKLHDAR